MPTLLIILVLVGAGSTYLTLSYSEFKLANRNVDLQSCVNLAEAGIEEAMFAMRHEDWSNWTQITTDQYYKGSANLGLGNGRMGSFRVYASILDGSAPIIFAQGEVKSHYDTVKKQIRLDLFRKGLFANGLTAKQKVVFNGNKITIDSYNSNYGNYDPNTNRNDKGTVGSLDVEWGSVNIGNADIWGYVATGGGNPDIGPNGTVRGEDSPSGVKVDSDRIALDFYADFGDISSPYPATFNNLLPQNGTIGSASATTPAYYKIGSYSNSSSDVLIVDGPVVIITDGDVSTKGEIQVTANGSVEWYISGNMDIGGNGIVNHTYIPSKMVIFGTDPTPGGKTIKVSGNGVLKAAVYAPNANLELKGGGSVGVFMGAAVANNITMTGNFDFHYDEALDAYSQDNGYKINRWRELVDWDEKVPLSVPSEMPKYAVSYDSQPVFTQPSNL